MPFKDPERRREHARLWHKMRRLHPDKHQRELEMNRVYDRQRYRRNPEERKLVSKLVSRRKQEKKFGVRYPTWWLCEVCNRPVSLFKGEIQLDHNPKTGLFRGWLCLSCNTTIGKAERFMSEFKRYLEW